MKLQTIPYVVQQTTWPAEGRHILAQYDDRSVVVYQAYRPSIGKFATRHGYFGGEFSFNRMSWIKPNFLWMMYRSGWGTKGDQEITLAVRIKREFFDAVLEQAVPSTYDADLYPDIQTWKQALASSEVRLQWDPDHHPSGAPTRRRALQLGLRGQVLAEYAGSTVIDIIDISEFVEAQRLHVEAGDYATLLTPAERVYFPSNPAIAKRLKLSVAGTEDSM